MQTDKKIESVKKIKEDLTKTKSIVLADHTGLNNQQIELLRKNVKQAGGKFTVIKNSLLKRALKDSSFSDKILDETLNGPTSAILAFEDKIEPIKELVKIASENNIPRIKQGALINRILTSEEVIRLSKLPAKSILIAQLLGMMKSPQTRLVYALKGNLIKLALIIKAISEKKQN